MSNSKFSHKHKVNEKFVYLQAIITFFKAIHTMNQDIRSLTPGLVWELFDDITAVPRPSKHEERICQWLIEFAKAHGLEYRTDKAGNVTILKPATQGMENRPTVVLQSHMDMVCEKNADTAHDFMTEGINT